jgi:RimJ/RimL family protein N-acetyltransferase
MARGAISLSDLDKRYPRTIECDGEEILLERLNSLDSDEVRKFSTTLSDHDLLFLSRDIREPKVVEAWSDSLGTNDLVTIAAKRQGEIVGTTAVVTDKHSWSAHVGELRILVSPAVRELGLGRELIQESFLIGLDLGLEKLTVRMTLDQERAITVFEEMGFKTEALLRDHVKDSEGEKHDLIIMSHDVAAVQSMMELYGVDQAF